MSGEIPAASPRWRQALAALRPRRPSLLLLALPAVLALWQGPRLLLGPEVAVSTVQRRDFVQSVVASGHVETPHRVSIAAQVVGTVRRVPVAEGQQVAAGELLLELESSEARAALAQAELAVRQAEARLRQLREVQAPVAEAGLRQARAGLDNARAQWGRAQELFRQGFIGQAALDETRKTLELSEAQARAAQTQLATAQPEGSDTALAVAALAQARASADAARARLGYASLRAPVAGQLISRDVEPGDVVQAGKTLMQLSPAGAAELVVQIDEKNLQLTPPAHWHWIARIAEAVAVPVVANGEVWNVADWEGIREVSGCADVMLGRGAVADPLLARRIKGEAIAGAEAWAVVEPALADFWRRVTAKLEPRHCPGRIKLWLGLLRRTWPEAEALYQRIRPARDCAAVEAGLAAAGMLPAPVA